MICKSEKCWHNFFYLFCRGNSVVYLSWFDRGHFVLYCLLVVILLMLFACSWLFRRLFVRDDFVVVSFYFFVMTLLLFVHDGVVVCNCCLFAVTSVIVVNCLFIMTLSFGFFFFFPVDFVVRLLVDDCNGYIVACCCIWPRWLCCLSPCSRPTLVF